MHEVRNNGDRVEIVIYDEIGERWSWEKGDTVGVSATWFKETLEEAGGRPVDLRIDSSGGDVFEAFAICSAIQRYEGEVVAHVDGLAASAASYVAVVCDEVWMNDYAYIMIHCASTFCWGNAREFEYTAARLRNIDSNLAEIYRKRSGLTLEEVIAYMEDETWFTADKALEAGLATKVVETEERMAACVDDEFARRYRHVPDGMQHKATVAAPKLSWAPSLRLGAIGATSDEPATQGDAPASDAGNTIDASEGGPSYTVLDGRIYEGIDE